MTRTLFLLAYCLSFPLSTLSAKESPGYPLALPPFQILDNLKDLPFDKAPKLTSDERSLLEKIWKQRSEAVGKYTPSDADVLDAMLFASGVAGEENLDKYRSKFKALVTRAKAATEKGKTISEKGDLLIRFLHKDVMAKGYELKQSSLADVFDTGKFNCVTGSAMYLLVGQQLGLTVVPISIPNGVLTGHATVDLVDGSKRIQVETTNANGFDWGTKLKQPGVVSLSFIPDRKNGFDVDALGVATMIYSNRGVDIKGDPITELQSIRWQLPAIILNPKDPTALNNLLVPFVNGGPKLADQGKYEQAAQVLAFGLAMKPDMRDLNNNQAHVWVRWIEATLAAEKDNEAMELFARAKKLMPRETDFQHPADWFARLGHKQTKQNGIDAGLKVADRAEKVLTGEEKNRLLKWKSELMLLASNDLLRDKDVDGALKILIQAYAASPDATITNGIAYFAQQSLFIVRDKSGTSAAVAHFKKLKQLFPKVKAIDDVGTAHAFNTVDPLRKTGKYPEALKLIGELEPMIPSIQKQSHLKAVIYDYWARSFTEQQEWVKSLETYKEGVKNCAGEESFLNGNSVATIDQWARKSMNSKDWAEAIRIYKLGEEYHPKNLHLENNRKYCEQQKAK